MGPECCFQKSITTAFNLTSSILIWLWETDLALDKKQEDLSLKCLKHSYELHHWAQSLARSAAKTPVSHRRQRVVPQRENWAFATQQKQSCAVNDRYGLWQRWTRTPLDRRPLPLLKKLKTVLLKMFPEENMTGAERSKTDDWHYSLQTLKTGILVWHGWWLCSEFWLICGFFLFFCNSFSKPIYTKTTLLFVVKRHASWHLEIWPGTSVTKEGTITYDSWSLEWSKIF